MAVVLSAQCTDKRVNSVTRQLFAFYPTPETLAEAETEQIFEIIRSISYPNAKAKYLKGIAQALLQRHGGVVPKTMEELTALPGVGRKTANVILAIVFKQAALAVDTHVFRVSHRLGLVSKRCSTPLSVERELRRFIPSELVAKAHFWLLHFGRYTCTALRPKCAKCRLQALCKMDKVNSAVSL